TRAALERVIGGGANTDWLFETTWPVQPLAGATPTQAVGAWVVMGEEGPLRTALAERLGDAGMSVLTLRPGAAWRLDGDDATVDEADKASWQMALAAASARGNGALAGVVLLPAPVDADAVADIDRLEAAQRRLLARALALAQALGETPARLWVVTRSTQAVAGSVPDLVQAPLWGLTGVIASELPALHTVRVDLEAEPRADEADCLMREITAPDGEERIALRGGLRHVARLTPSQAQPRLPEAPLRLEITERGTLENLKLLPVTREKPGPGQVEIRVHATGLNFRDVLNALGMYPGDPGPLGNECAGVVSAVGEGVTEFALGDEVVSMVDRSFATWVVAPVALTVLKPASMSFAEAATVPVTFLTAQYALHDLSRIKKGDRVLIHAVTGGVGMAALQLALRAGATVFGTAGTPAKRALAKRLGAHHVADSRSLSFAPDVRAATGGEGVDIVLNSLAGDFIPESLALLKPGGHFVEIGKTGIWDAARVAEAYPGVHYHPLYLGEVAAAQPLFVRGMLAEILRDIGRGELSALPLRTWPLEDAEQAFRFMGQGHHTGKIVITQAPPPRVRPDARYLVTGGLGGLGLACAGWLADAGAQHLVLMGRRAPGPAAQAAIDGLRERGVAVEVLACDVADGAALSASLQPLVHDPAAPLRGILHAAGAVDDAMLAELDMDRFDRVMSPKVRGTWNLDRLARTLPMDFFVCFSSGAALLGSAGQGNYAAANTFMDALAWARRAAGHHGLSINWGSWAGAGMAAGVDDAHRRRWAAQGLAMIEPDEGTGMLAALLLANRHAQAAAIPLVRARLPADLGPFYSLIQPSRPAGVSAKAEAAAISAAELLPRLRAAGADEARALLRSFLAGQVVSVLALGSAQTLDTQRSLMDLGMDSLMAIELRNRVQVATEVRLAVADLLNGPSV
ncbi:MAG: SDR family NAD(P)-dependent oxidoreductase, partial [Rhodocyclaceae bacterium]